jgi:hypothetical protein
VTGQICRNDEQHRGARRYGLIHPCLQARVEIVGLVGKNGYIIRNAVAVAAYDSYPVNA